MTSPEYVRVCSWASLGWEHGQVEVPGVDDQKRWASTSQAHRTQAALVMTVTCLLNLTWMVAWWNILLETDKPFWWYMRASLSYDFQTFTCILCVCVTYDVCRVTLMAVSFYEMSPWRRGYAVLQMVTSSCGCCRNESGGRSAKVHRRGRRGRHQIRRQINAQTLNPCCWLFALEMCRLLLHSIVMKLNFVTYILLSVA